MLTADFWLKKIAHPDKKIAKPSEIEVFNQEIMQKSSEFVHDLAQYPVEITKEKLSSLLDESSFMLKEKYLGNKLLDDEYYHNLQAEIDSDSILDKVTIKYGFTVGRSNLRILPTNDFVTNRQNDYEFDRLQETAITIAQPLLILHVSRSRHWYFVQSYYASGWISANHVAVADNKKEWLSYTNAENFLVVTANRMRLGFNPYSPEISELEFCMGDKLPIVNDNLEKCIDGQSIVGNHVVKLPVRGQEGQLGFKLALVPVVSDVCQGYLPYTRENILRQSFKMQGDRYGWGGSRNSRDCSSFIMDIYRSFGFKLPRNTWSQMNTAGRTVDFVGKTVGQRRKLLNNLELGAALYFRGHVMLYLGEDNGEYYVIHAIAECGDSSKRNADDTITSIPLYNIMVTPLSLLRTNGQSLFAALTIGKLFE